MTDLTSRPLPYAKDALEPHISRETLAYHHGKHYQGYVDKLAAAIHGTALAGRSLSEIVCTTVGTPAFDLAAQAWNHEFYFAGLSPTPTRTASGPCADAIDLAFGSFDAMCARFRASAGALFGSGWTWLVLDPESGLDIVNTANADTPLVAGKMPLLVCDVWEHAYYIDYRNERARYLDAFFAVVDWSVVAEHYRAARLHAAA